MEYSFDFMDPNFTSSLYGGSGGSYSPDFSTSFMDPDFNWSGITGNSAYDFSGGLNYAPVTDRSFNYQSEAPSFYDQIGGMKGALSLGMGGLSLLGNYLRGRDQDELARDQLKAQTGLKQQELDTLNNMDLAKTDALMRLVQERQGVQALDPRRYAQVLASGQLPVEDIVARQGIDIGAMAHGGMYAGGGQPQGPQGALGLLRGASGGQMDDVNSALSHGEYVVDADVVAALGDGNTEAGARKLDEMRERVRAHKRGAPASKIPPQAKDPMAYLKGR